MSGALISELSCSLSVSDNPGKHVVNALQFTHVETRQTPEEKVTVIKLTTHQGISQQDSILISVVQSNPPGITHLKETCHTNIADMISKGKFSINPHTKDLIS